MNPYAQHLEGREPMEIIAASAGQLEALMRALGPARVEKPRAPGKWSPREIACHLADCEIAFGFRLRQALAEEQHTIQPFDQDRWARPYAAYDAAAAVAVFTAVRNWTLTLLRSLPAEAFDKAVTHPERGSMRFRDLVATMAGHDRNHLKQLAACS